MASRRLRGDAGRGRQQPVGRAHVRPRPGLHVARRPRLDRPRWIRPAGRGRLRGTAALARPERRDAAPRGACGVGRAGATVRLGALVRLPADGAGRRCRAREPGDERAAGRGGLRRVLLAGRSRRVHGLRLVSGRRRCGRAAAADASEDAVNGSSASWLALAGAYTLVFTGLSGDDRWFVRTGIYPGVCAALAFERPLTVSARTPVERRLRVLVADGALDHARVRAYCEA